MANVGDSFSPGAAVPDSGIYTCTTCNGTKGAKHKSTNVKGHTFPPAECAGAKWKLTQKTHP